MQDFIPRKKSGKHKDKEPKGGGKERFKKNVMILYVVMIHKLAQAKFDELPFSRTEIAHIVHLSTTNKISKR